MNGVVHSGGHYPLLAYTANATCNRSEEAEKRRSHQKHEKSKRSSSRIEPAVAAQQRSAHNQSTAWASYVPTVNANVEVQDANQQRRQWTTSRADANPQRRPSDWQGKDYYNRVCGYAPADWSSSSDQWYTVSK